MTKYDWLKMQVQRAVEEEIEECIEWEGAKEPFGYGSLRVNGKKENAHVQALSLVEVKPEDGHLECCHSCNNPSCINPNHLRWASRSDNMRDARKAKTLRGQKLSGEDVDKIRDLQGEVGCTTVGRMFGVHDNTILDIWNGHTWSGR